MYASVYVDNILLNDRYYPRLSGPILLLGKSGFVADSLASSLGFVFPMLGSSPFKQSSLCNHIPHHHHLSVFPLIFRTKLGTNHMEAIRLRFGYYSHIEQ